MHDILKTLALPDDYVASQGERGVVVWHVDFEQRLRAAHFDEDARRGAETFKAAHEAGREPLALLELGAPESTLSGPTQALVRRFTHGGILRAITGTRYSDPKRPFVELQQSERLRTHGVPTPRVLAARAVRARLFGYELALVTERLEGTRDIGHLIGDVRSGAAPKRKLRMALVDAAHLICQMHQHGFVHADLQPANLLVHEGAQRGAIALDLDGSRFADGPMTAEERIANLARLWRHVKRRESDYGAVFQPAELALFLRVYGVARADIAGWMQRIDGRVEKRRGVHRLGWLLERAFGRSVDQRAKKTRG